MRKFLPIFVAMALNAQFVGFPRYRTAGDVLKNRKFFEKYSRVRNELRRFWQMYGIENYPAIRAFQNSKAVYDTGTVTIRVLALRVEFQREDPDDPLTTGDGTFVMEDNGEDRIVTICNGDTIYNPFYDPPHDWVYFNRQMEALADYYYVATFGKVKIEWVVKPDSGRPPIKLPHPMRYYGDTINMATGLVTLVRDAFIAADTQDSTIRFNDLDGNGINDALEGVWDRYIIFHAGSAWQSDLLFDTPFDIAAVTIPAGALEYYLGTPFIVLNEGQDTVYDASLLPETMAQDGEEIKLQGTLIHEQGHNFFFLPDLYDTYMRGSGIGSFGIMTTSPYLGVKGQIPEGLIVPLPNVWERIWMDWFVRYVFGRGFLNSDVLQTVDPAPVAVEFTLKTKNILVDSLGIFRSGEVFGVAGGNFLEDPYSSVRFLKIPINEHEYFLVENEISDIPANDSVFVCNGDTWDVHIRGKYKDGVVVHFYGENDFLIGGAPGESRGLLIWHIDDNIIWQNWGYNEVNAVRPMGVDLLEADHVQDFERWTENGYYSYTWFGSPYDLYFEGNNTEASDTSHPSTRDNSGASTKIKIFDIGEPDTVMTFKLVREIGGLSFRAGYTSSPTSVTVPTVSFINSAGDFYIIAQNVRRFLIDPNTLDSTLVDTFALVSLYSNIGLPFDVDTIRGTVAFEPAVYTFDSVAMAIVPMRDGRIFKFLIDKTSGVFTGVSVAARLPSFSTGPPSIAVVDGNIRIYAGCDDQNIYVIDPDSGIVGRFFTASPQFSTPVFTDQGAVIQSADGRLIFTDSSLSAVDTALFNPEIVPTKVMPIYGDADNDGTKEVVTVTSGGKLYVVDPETKVIEMTAEFSDSLVTPLAAGDLDGDGYLEFVFGTQNYIYAFNHLGSLLSGFPVEVQGPKSQPVIGDVDADGRPDLIIGVGNEGIFAFNWKGQLLPGYPIATGDSVSFSMMLKSDGREYRLVYISNGGFVSVWRVGDTTGYWTQYGNGPEHHGRLLVQPRQAYTPDFRERLYFYPNPTYDGFTTFRMKIPAYSDVRLEFFTFSGHKMKELVFRGVRADDFVEKRLNLTDLPSGIYYVKITYADKTKILKLAIVR